MHPTEMAFLKKIIAKNAFPELKNRDFVVTDFKHTGEDSSLRIHGTLSSSVFINSVTVHYRRFNLVDYYDHTSGDVLTVPLAHISSPEVLVNYMNDKFINSVAVRWSSRNFELFRNFYYKLTVDSLERFSLDGLQVGHRITLNAHPDSYLFEGSVNILIV